MDRRRNRHPVRKLARPGIFRALVLVFVAALLEAAGALAKPTDAAPAALDCRSVALTAPSEGAELSGVVEIRGKTVIPDFAFFKVEYSPAGVERWILIGTDVIRQPVTDDRLAVWETSSLPDGPFELRLRVVDRTGNYCDVLVRSLDIANTRPANTSTLETLIPATETPELTVVPPQPTLTPKPVVNADFYPAQSTPATVPARASPMVLPSMDWTVLGAFFLFGAATVIGIALLGVALLFVRRLG